jgi:predicted AAA+ superfamily ATPase
MQELKSKFMKSSVRGPRRTKDNPFTKDSSHEQPTKSGHTWTCPSSGEYGLIGYTIQQWIQTHAESTLKIQENHWAEITVAPGHCENYLRDGLITFVYQGVLYAYFANWSEDFHRVFSDNSDAPAIDAIKHSIRWENPYRRQHLQIMACNQRSGLEMEPRKAPDTAFESVIIDDGIRQELRDNTVFHLQEIPGDNGIILHGPPGTGKSLSCQAIIKETIEAGYSTCYVVGRIDFDFLDRMLERYLAPCLVILEDIDTYAQDRQSNPHAYFSDFLQFMSGLSEREEKIVVIATTNHIDYLDDAIARRPVRFNRRFHIDLPDEIQLQALLQHYFGANSTLPDDAVRLCRKAKFTGSHIAEIRRTSEIFAIKQKQTPIQCFQQAFDIVSTQFANASEAHCVGFAS